MYKSIQMFLEEISVAWNCDVCGEPIHFKKLENGKIVATKCPLEQYKTVKSFFTQEIKYLPTKYPDIPVTNSPEDLRKLKGLVPNTTPLSSFADKKDKTYFVKSLLISCHLRTFYLHFVRFLSDFYGDNSVHFIESGEIATGNQFNYLWLTGTLLKDCFFRETGNQSKFKSMSDLINPSLVIYSLGEIESMQMKNKGDILMELLTSRHSHGKSTWIIYSKPFSDCDETKTSENLRLYLSNSSYIPRIKLDEDEDDPEVFSSSVIVEGGSTQRKSKRGKSTVGSSNDPYKLM